jgi:hypothetical protein
LGTKSISNSTDHGCIRTYDNEIRSQTPGEIDD